MAILTRVNFPNVPLTAAEDAAVDAALLTWANTLLNPVNIFVGISKIPMPGGHNAISIPNLFQHGGRTLTTALAKALPVNIPLGMNVLDMMVWFDAGTPWVTGGPVILPGQFDLETTILHEICHSLGFHGLCSVDHILHTGQYSDTNLIAALPAGLNPFQVWMAANLVTGPLTPFANLFVYNNHGDKTVPADNYVAFRGGNIVGIPLAGQVFNVYTPGLFVPFTSCDHIDYAVSLMYATTLGQIIRAPDFRTTDILGAIGWNI